MTVETHYHIVPEHVDTERNSSLHTLCIKITDVQKLRVFKTMRPFCHTMTRQYFFCDLRYFIPDTYIVDSAANKSESDCNFGSYFP